jgi:serine/threonine protein kinase
LITRHGRILLADFGLTRDTRDVETPDGSGATVYYAAPELFRECDFDDKVDVFSFGYILYEILVGRPVFSKGTPPFEIIRKHRERYIPTIPATVVPVMRRIIEQCCSFDPASRPTFNDILSDIELSDFAILPGVNAEGLQLYVNGIKTWGLASQSQGPSYRVSIIDRDSPDLENDDPEEQCLDNTYML